jgi:Protein of unknown function (DUF2793)
MSGTVTLPSADGTGFNTYTLASFTGRNYAKTAEGQGWFNAMLDMAYAMQTAWSTTSTSSHSFSVGSKVFAIGGGGAGFAVGSPVRIIKSSTEVMDGTVTAFDLAAQTMTVNVASVTGSGTHASWSITQMNFVSTTVSTPVSEANGGTAASTFAGARTNMGVTRTFVVKSVVSTPPGSPLDQDKHLVGDSPTGAWSGQENKIATFTTGVGWSFVSADKGDHAYDQALLQHYTFTDVDMAALGIWVDSRWRPATPVKVGSVIIVSTGTTTITTAQVGLDTTIRANLSGGSGTINLPTPTLVPGAAFRVLLATTGTLTVQVTGGTTINGSATQVISTQYAVKTFVSAGTEITALWYMY